MTKKNKKKPKMKSFAKSYLKVQSRFNRVGLVAFTVLFGALGYYLLFSSRAATPSIMDYINTPNKVGGQEVIVPCGTYVGGQGQGTSRADWLVLKAPTPGCVIVDLSSTGLWFKDADYKIVFAGFKFVNGGVNIMNSSNVIFWHTEHSFPPDIWKQQFLAAGGQYPVNASNCQAMLDIRNHKMANGLPAGIRTDHGWYGNGQNKNRHIGLYGVDIHDVGDDGMMFYGMDDLKIQGTRIWNVDEKGYDPAIDCGIDDAKDWWHNDSIQTTGGVSEVRVSDSWFAQVVQWGADSDISNSSFTNIWLAGSPSTGSLLSKGNGSFIKNSFSGIRSFGNGQAHLGDTWQAVWRTDFNPCPVPDDPERVCQAVWLGDDGQQPWPYDFRGQPGWDVTAPKIDTTPPAGVTLNQQGRLVNGINEIKDHSQNPAKLWRAAHPYESYESTLGISIANKPPSTPPPTPSPGPGTTANPNASADAKAVLSYLSGLSSRSTHRTISGEFLKWSPGTFNAPNTVYANTGHWLGLVGADYGYNNGNFQGVNDLLTTYWNQGGLVTLSYHSPNPFTGGDVRDMTGVDIPAALRPGTPQRAKWLAQMDATASGLQQLENNGVVVLWRPFHEMTNCFFWWGCQNAGEFQSLWRDMFDYFTYTKGLNNLIWVYGAGAETTVMDYYPGSAYVDVVGVDHYQNLSASSCYVEGIGKFTSLGKPIAFTEFGPSGDGYNWLDLLACIKQKYPEVIYVLTWHDHHGLDYAKHVNSKAMLDDPWMANREDIAWKSGTPPPTSKPNLVVNSLTATPANPKTGDKVNFSAAITNAGSVPTPNGVERDLSFRIDGTEVTWAIDFVGSLAPGQSVTLSTDSGTTAGKWTATQGSHTLEAYVDNLSRISETNENDNTRSIPLTVTNSPPPANIPPTISLTAPTNGFTANAPATVAITANASDSDGSITKVEFFNGSTKLGEDTTAPYSFNWTNVGVGSYSLTAKATDNQGATKTSAAITMTVTNPPKPDLIITALSMTPTNPKPGDKVRFSATIKNANAATAATPANVIHDTQFYINDVPITWSDNYRPAQNSKPNGLQPGEEVTITANGGPNAEMSTGLWTATAGTLNLSAYVNACPTGCTGGDRITNEASRNNNSLSQQLIVASLPPLNESPAVALTSPRATDPFRSPATINFSATASDPDGTVAKVEFYQGTTKLGEDTSSPYSFSWTSIGPGNYNLTAKATDNQGAITTSTSVAITVAAKRGDLDRDNKIDQRDLDFIFNKWRKPATPAEGDLSGDGTITLLDLSMLLKEWGR